MSTHYAFGRLEPRKVGVQHHHAHMVSAMAEHGLHGPVIGIAYDGTGYGGVNEFNSWGAEVLTGDARSFTRMATWRPLALPGGDMAVRQPWRAAVALLEDAFGAGADFDGFPAFAGADVDLVRHMIRQRVNTPFAHGMGRYFDAVAALVLGRARVTFEGQLAMELNAIADPSEHGIYPFDLEEIDGLPHVDFRMATREIVADLRKRVPPSIVSAKFHNTVAAATAFLVRHTVARIGNLPIVLTGGCFQNARLAESLVVDLSARHHVLLHRHVPPGDGGIALGQAVVAGWRADL
jgi:hydrogenase maturation protein HypF